MGKAYANRKPIEDRPEADFYGTPISLVDLAIKEILPNHLNSSSLKIWEPACGDGAISERLIKAGFTNLLSSDIRETDYVKQNGKVIDFLSDSTLKGDVIITNPPFSLFDEFVMQAKKKAKLVIFIGKLNFFGAYNRWKDGVWDYLMETHIFNRQVDYRTPYREDGLFHVGNLVTGWFVWRPDQRLTTKFPWQSSIMDVQPWAKLGSFKEEGK